MHRDGTRAERSVTNPIKREKKKEGEIRYGVFSNFSIVFEIDF